MRISLSEGSGWSSKDDISKRIFHPKPAVGLFSRIYFSKLLAEYTRCEKKTAH